jgi:hypothetical protein
MKYYEQILFLTVFGVIFYYAIPYNYDSVTNYKRGLIGSLVVIVAEGTLRNYEGPFIRPN